MEKNIDDIVLIKEYQSATKAGKEMLVRLYGSEIFEPKCTDRIKTFEDACKDQKLNPKDVLPYVGKKLTIEQQVLNAYAMLRVIAKSLQGSWNPDWTNGKQQKWFVWFEYKSNGFGVGGTGYDYRFTVTYVGSRLCFPNSEMAKYFGQQFLDLHNIVLKN